MTRLFRFLPLLVLTLFCVQFASAQSTFDVNVGFGAAQDKATTGIDTNSFLNCTSSTAAGACSKTASLSNFFLGIGGRLMLWKHFGVGASIDVQPKQATYASLVSAVPTQGIPQIDLKTRVMFWGFDGVVQPVSSKKASLQIVGGFGGANVKFYEAQSSTGSLLGNFNSSQYASSSNHFQVHGGVGVQVYVSGNMYIRPEFDIHYVPNFVQFGRNTVTQEMVWIGYSFGNR